MELKDLRKLLLSILVIIPCVTFVTYQSIICIQKYRRQEIGTKLSFEDPAHHIFPSITICRDGRTGNNNRFNPWLNRTQLENCKLYWYAYFAYALWSGKGNENCTDPAKLYESIVGKPDDFIYYIKYSFFRRGQAYRAYINSSTSKKTLSIRYVGTLL